MVVRLIFFIRRPGSVRPGRATGLKDWQPTNGQMAAVAADERSQLRRESMGEIVAQE
jgi:hypothetical protein